MPNPVTIPCPENIWTLVEDDQVFGFLYKKKNNPNRYLYTYRLTGEAAPTDRSEGAAIFEDGKNCKFIIAGLGIDIYVMAVGGDGEVRYDWWW
jgi:hypothetical protein